jgi:hypothetical protein
MSDKSHPSSNIFATSAGDNKAANEEMDHSISFNFYGILMVTQVLHGINFLLGYLETSINMDNIIIHSTSHY